MGINDAVVIVLGLTLFEVISSIDNAVINADVISTLSEKWRRWFLTYGIFFAVFVVRGVLPLIIVWASAPELSLWQAFSATMSGDAAVRETIERQAPMLLAGGGVFLVLLFLHWLFLEKKKYAFFIESHIHKNLSVWFYGLASLFLLVVVFVGNKINPLISLGAVTGSSAFFIMSGFKQNAEAKEDELLHGHMSALSKIMYLEIIDLTFSIDGVLGAFAFTLSVPLILLGNGIGAYVVRTLTVRGVATVKKYAYLKNGAMYSVGVLGFIMVLESIGRHVESWVSPSATLCVVAVFFWLSVKELKKEKVI